MPEQIKFPTRYVIYIAIQNYLDEAQIKNLREQLGRRRLGDKEFINTIRKHIDIELLRTKPFIWQDIWIYNYLMYDFKTKFVRNKLINNYIKEIIVPQKHALEEIKKFINTLNY